MSAAPIRVALAALALLLAGLTYVVARAGLRLHGWLAPLGPLPRVEVPVAVAQVVPDALWQFSFCVLVFELWARRPHTPVARACLAAPVVLGLGSEVAQGFGWLEGVFDPADLLAMIAATAAAAVLVWGWPRRPDEVGTPAAAGHSVAPAE